MVCEVEDAIMVDRQHCQEYTMLLQGLRWSIRAIPVHRRSNVDAEQLGLGIGMVPLPTGRFPALPRTAKEGWT